MSLEEKKANANVALSAHRNDDSRFRTRAFGGITMKRVLLAIALGVVTTFAVIGLAFVADDLGFESFARALAWPNTLLQSLTPSNNIGTLDHPVTEGTPLNALAFYASIPLGVLIYGFVAYMGLRLTKRTKL